MSWLQKRLVCFFIILLLISSTPSQSNEICKTPSITRSWSHGIILDLISLPMGGLALEYQHPLTSYVSLTVPFETHFNALSLVPPDITELIRSFGFGLAPDKSVLSGVGALFHYQGWYVEPMIKFGYAQIFYPEPVGTESFFQLRPGVMVGYQAIFDFGLMVKIGLGTEWRIFFPHELLTNALAPDATLSLGYAF